MNKGNITLLLVLALAAGAVLIGWSLSGNNAEVTVTSSGDSKKAGTAIGDTAPDFRLTRMDGATVARDDLRGQPAVIVFWTAWCPVCKEEAPRINKLASLYEPLGVRVLGINIQDSQARVEAGIKDFGIRFPVARDPDASVARRYKVTGTPTLVFLDRNGVVSYFGNELPEDYTQRLDGLIAGS